MEKKWIHRIGFFGACLLTASPSRAEAPEVAPTSRSVEVQFEVPVENGDLSAARDKAQLMAFEKAMERAIPVDVPSEIRATRIKQAVRYVKSFRALEEKNLGDRLSFRYNVEIQASAFEGLKPEIGPPAEPRDWSVEIVFSVPTSAASLVNRIEQDVKVTVHSFKLTRSALILSLTSSKSEDQLRGGLQTSVGSIGTFSLFPKASPVRAPSSEVGTNAGIVPDQK